MSEQKKAVDAATLARREYHRNWRKNNPDKVRKYNIAYWTKVAERKEVANNENENDKRSK